jgi:hypothetical protein
VRGVHDAVAARIDELDDAARGLLELACVAGQPLPVALAIRSAEVTPQVLPALLARSLLRTSVLAEQEYLESYHDRIRETVLASMPEARRDALHIRLAHALSALPEPDAERVALHYRAAGRHAEAAPYVVRAAQRASHAFAFGRAAQLYELALGQARPEEVLELSQALADACANTGRIVEAAEHYERVAARIERKEERRELRSKAMVLHLLAGQLERGIRLLDPLCRELFVRPMPHRRWLAVLLQLLLLLRYLLGRSVPRLPVPTTARHTAGSAEAQALCVRATRGFAHLSLDYGSYFALKSLIATRRHHDPRVWPIGIAWDIGIRTAFRGARQGKDDADMARALRLAEEQHDDEARAIVLSTDGARCYACGDFAGSVAAFARAEEVLWARGRALTPIFNGARSGRLACWLATGELSQLTASSTLWLAEAESLNDPLGMLLVGVMASYRFLALDRPEAVAAAVAPMFSPLGQRTPFSADAWWVGDVALYRGDFAGALAAIRAAHRSPYFRAMQRTPSHRAWDALFVGRAHLAAARTAPRALAVVERAQRTLSRSRYAPAAPMAAQLAAGIALVRGDLEAALPALTRAAQGYRQSGMQLPAAAMRYHRGVLLGGGQGAQLVAAATAAAHELGVKDPEHWFHFLLPGRDLS